jgi:PiT family inorganic phosphate transporter
MEGPFILKFLTLLLGLYMAWNIGANDVANAMGTSVGSKALTLRRAVFLAAILEFCGAFFVGSSVSQTIQEGIVRLDAFPADPLLFCLGMMGSLLATGILLQIASYFGLPVSTTHAIVGAILGFGMVVGGVDAIHWDIMGKISTSWILSPLLSGAAAYLLFSFIEHGILRAPNPAASAQKWAPYFLFFSLNVAILSLFYQGPKELDLHLSLQEALFLSCPLSFLASLLSYFLLQRQPQLATTAGSQELSSCTAEKIFIYLQIMSACLVAFAHGANDVANAIGPVAAVLNTLDTKKLGTLPATPPWLLLLGGIGIVLGLAAWGWRVIETVGKKITELTPAKGFAAELGAAATILFASKLGLPISTTHALIGAICGVGMAQGLKTLNLQMLRGIILSWVITIPLCAILSAGLFYLLQWIFI